MTGDITVLGLHPTTCVLADIGMDVPHGTTAVIPADKAARSHDLWRSISQRYLFQIKSGAAISNAAPNPLRTENEELRGRVRYLEEENQALRKALQLLEGSQQTKLDAILGLLQGASKSVLPYSPGGYPPEPPEGVAAVVEVSPPPFIPSKIRSDESLQARVQTEKGSSDASVTEATTRLREIRHRGSQ